MVRIAPTPSGLLHMGNAFNFLLCEAVAHEAGRGLRLRIDDGDAARVRDEYLQDIFDTLEWLAIRPDAGPVNVADHQARFRQALRRTLYDAYLAELAAGGHLFACTCSRADIGRSSPDGQYPGTCRDRGLPLDTPEAAWRLRVPVDAVVSFTDAFQGRVVVSLYNEMRDPVLRRRDGIAAYAISSLADDVLYETTHIVRGEDLLVPTALQRYLAGLLPRACTFSEVTVFHHPLLLAPDGGKLSKSAGAASLQHLRREGVTGEAIRARFAAWRAGLGGSQSILGRPELVDP